MSNDLILRPDAAVRITKDTKAVTVKQDRKGIDVPAVLRFLTNSTGVVNALRTVKKGTQYVVQVPAHLQPGLDSGKYTMLHGESSGKTWATIVEPSANGKNTFVANCPIAEEAFSKAGAIQNLTMTMQNAQMQHQLAEIKQLAEETLEKVQQVLQGQQNDRIGLLRSGSHDMKLAMMEGDPEARKRQIELARSKISTAQEQIGEDLKDLAERYKKVPLTKFELTFNELIKPGYLKKADDAFYEIENRYGLYLKAVQLHAASYAVTGDTERAEVIFDDAYRFLKSINFGRVSTFRHMDSESKRGGLFCDHIERHIREDKQLCLDAAKPVDFIQIPVKGEEILEVLEYA